MSGYYSYINWSKTLSVLLQMSNIRNIVCTYVKYTLDMSDTEYTAINITLNSHERLHFIPFSKLLNKMNQMFLDTMKLSFKSMSV